MATDPAQKTQVTALILSASQVAEYHREGFLVLPALSTPSEIARLRAIYDHHFHVRSGREQGAQFDLFGRDNDDQKANVPQILGLSRFAPEVKDTLLYRNVAAVLSQLFGIPHSSLGDHAICKPPHCLLATPWHQDEAYWDAGSDYCGASVWVPLQDVDEHSGCMHFIPRSHWGEVLPHRSHGGDPTVHGLEIDGDYPHLFTKAVPCPLLAGGCTIHHQRLLHHTTPNTSPEPRRAWIFTGGIPPVPRQHAKDLPWERAKRTARAERVATFAARKADS